MKDSHQKLSYERLLDPKLLRPRLIFVSIYITTYELLRAEIIDKIKDFFSNSYEADKGWIVGDEYYKSLGIDKERIKGLLPKSIEWLKQKNVIDSEDEKNFIQITNLRDRYAHELSQMITDYDEENERILFEKQINLLKKISVWWIKNVDMAIDPDAYPEEVPDDEIVPGKLMIIQILSQVGLSQDEEAEELLREFKKSQGKE